MKVTSRVPTPRRAPTRHERSRTFHPPAGDDHAGHGGHFAVRPCRLPPVAGERFAERGLSDHPGVGEFARRKPGNDGLRRGDAAGKTIFHHRRRGFDVIGQLAGRVQVTIQFSLDRNIDARRRTCRRQLRRRRNNCRRTCRRRRLIKKSIRRIRRLFFWRCRRRRCRFPRWTITRKICWRNKFRWSTASRRSTSSARSLTPCACKLTRTSSRPTDSALIRSSRRSRQGNVNQPLGTLYGKHQAFTVEANGQLMNAAAFRPMIVAYRNGNPVRLQQLGSVLDSVQNDKVMAWYNSTRAVVLAVQRQPGANTVEVVDSIRKLLPQFRAAIPASVNLDVLIDRSLTIRKSVSDVEHTLVRRRVPRRDGHFYFPAKCCRRRLSRASRCRCPSSARSP
jgi:hypothetical protein